MKNSILVIMFSMLSLGGFAQDDQKAIESVIRSFAKAADQNDAALLGTYLDENYRIVMNRLFGSPDVSVVSKADYLAKIESKEWGGDNREVTIMQTIVNGTTASVHASLKGEKATFISLYTLIKDAEGNWKLASDTPIIAG